MKENFITSIPFKRVSVRTKKNRVGMLEHRSKTKSRVIRKRVVVRFRQSGTSDGTDLSSIMEKQIADLNGKIKTLSFRVKKSVEVVKKHDRVASERHKKSLETMITAVNTLKESIEEKGEAEEAVQEWATDIEAVVDEADECIRELTAQMEQIDRECSVTRVTRLALHNLALYFKVLWDRTLHVLVERLYNRVAGENAFSFHREILL